MALSLLPYYFYLELGLVCKKLNRFVEYTLVECFGDIVQSALIACCQGYENSNFIVVAETMKFHAISSYV